MRGIAIIVLAGLMVGVLLFAGCGVPTSEVEELNAQIAQLETEKAELIQETAALETQVTDLEAQLASQLENPTYEEAVAFIEEDDTDKGVPIDHGLAAMLVAENAANQGIKCYWVIARLAAGFGYNFVGFNTTDRGWIYFCNSGTCPDSEIKLEVGKKWHQLNPGFGGAPDFDDAIVSIHYLPIP